MKWIKVKHGLPQPGREVLLYLDGGIVVGHLDSRPAINKLVWNTYFGISGSVINQVTHWMPLPEKPKD